VVNADKISVTGGKLDDKMYYRFSGYPSGLAEISLRDQLKNHPERVIQAAVLGMLKLKVYAGETHPHQAQQPKKLEL